MCTWKPWMSSSLRPRRASEVWQVYTLNHEPWHLDDEIHGFAWRINEEKTDSHSKQEHGRVRKAKYHKLSTGFWTCRWSCAFHSANYFGTTFLAWPWLVAHTTSVNRKNHTSKNLGHWMIPPLHCVPQNLSHVMYISHLSKKLKVYAHLGEKQKKKKKTLFGPFRLPAQILCQPFRCSKYVLRHS